MSNKENTPTVSSEHKQADVTLNSSVTSSPPTLVKRKRTITSSVKIIKPKEEHNNQSISKETNDTTYPKDGIPVEVNKTKRRRIITSSVIINKPAVTTSNDTAEPSSNASTSIRTNIIKARRAIISTVKGFFVQQAQPVNKDRINISTAASSSVEHIRPVSPKGKEVNATFNSVDTPSSTDTSSPVNTVNSVDTPSFTDTSTPVNTSNSPATPAPADAPILLLSEEQKKVHDLIVYDRKNVFFTGAAGTGKSLLLRTVIKTLQSRYSPERVAITAPTGIAAVNIGGVTINRFAGIGIGDRNVDYYLARIRETKEKLKSWLATRVLIIDEISMLNGKLLDLVETLARTIRCSSEPFGGIQVIFCGDFYQLPPIDSKLLAFESDCWSQVVQESRVLKTVFRQRDMKFVNLLNKLRLGEVSDENKNELLGLQRNLKIEAGIVPTELYSMRYEVQAANGKRLEALQGPAHFYKSVDTGDQNLLDKCMAEPNLTLKVGAQVMLIKNLDETLVNGSLGIVKGFTAPDKDKKTYPIVQFTNGTSKTMTEEKWDITVKGALLAERTQIPLILAWAMSIHKAQGKTIEYVKVDLDKVFEAGQAYTAISRATDLEKLQVLNFRESVVKTEPRVIKFHEELEKVVK